MVSQVLKKRLQGRMGLISKVTTKTKPESMNDMELLTKHFTLLSSADVVDFVNTLLKELQLLV